MDLLSDNCIVGECEDLCPISEVNLRKRNNLIHYYEKKLNVFVSEFTRSAADKKLSCQENLRTIEAMERTLDFLFRR